MATALQISPEMTAGEVLVGAGTLALALFTWWLALRTSADVKSNEEQVRLSREGIELSRQSIEALDQPFLVPQPRKTDLAVQIHEGWLSLAIANHGKGAGILERVSLFHGQDDFLPYPPWNVEVIPARRQAEVVTRMDLRNWPAEHTRLVMRISYRSSSGSRYVTDSTTEVTRYGLALLGHRRLLVPS